MAYANVPFGPFFGCTKAEIVNRIATVRAAQLARAPGQGALTSASVNGSSFTYDVRANGGMTITEELANLQEALAYVDDDAPAITNEQVFAARNCTYPL